jgi:DNA-binding response OmpR family regulator
LVIEDEPDLRQALAQSLRENGYAVDEPARPVGSSRPPLRNDAIVLDLMLPQMRGGTVARMRQTTDAVSF